jgi:hypothetical protein
MTDSDLSNLFLLGALFLGGGAFGVVFWLWPAFTRRGPGRAIPGAFKIKKHRYSYEMGDVLLRFGGASVFAGMDIHLPKYLPHIYLDTYANDRRGRPEFVFAGEDVLSLGEDVDRYLRVYAAKKHKKLAQAVLTPGVLQALMQATYKVDVEIMDDHVRLIVVGAPVSADPQMQSNLLKTAKAIMKQVDQTLIQYK